MRSGSSRLLFLPARLPFGNKPPALFARHPAAQRARLDVADEKLVAFRQRTAPRNGEPQPEKLSLAIFLRVILVIRARVVDEVVVEELDVARLERHVERELVGEDAEKVERFLLRLGESRHFGEF